MSSRLVVGLLVCASLCVSRPAVAQRGLGQIGPSGTQAAGAIVGAAAVIGLVVYLAIPKQKTIEGCVESADGVSRLSNEKDHHVYIILSDSAALKSGQRLKLKGKKSRDRSGALHFRVKKLVKDEGTCDAQSPLQSADAKTQDE